MNIYKAEIARTVIQYITIKEIEAESEEKAREYIKEDMRKYRARIEDIATVDDVDDVDYEIEKLECTYTEPVEP